MAIKVKILGGFCTSQQGRLWSLKLSEDMRFFPSNLVKFCRIFKIVFLLKTRKNPHFLKSSEDMSAYLHMYRRHWRMLKSYISSILTLRPRATVIPTFIIGCPVITKWGHYSNVKCTVITSFSNNPQLLLALSSSLDAWHIVQLERAPVKQKIMTKVPSSIP